MRRILVVIGLMVLAACGPKDQESCKVQAAKGANSVAALNVLLEDCERQYPAIRRDDGSYAYYDSVLSEWVSVSGPTLAASDMEKVQRLRRVRQEAQATLQEKTSANRKEALKNLSLRNYDISCNIDDTYIKCYDKNITLQVKNNSNFTIYGITVSYEIGKSIDCSGSLGKSFHNDITVPPQGVGSIVKNVKFEDAGPEGIISGCVRISGVGAVSGEEVPRALIP